MRLGYRTPDHPVLIWLSDPLDTSCSALPGPYCLCSLLPKQKTTTIVLRRCTHRDHMTFSLSDRPGSKHSTFLVIKYPSANKGHRRTRRECKGNEYLRAKAQWGSAGRRVAGPHQHLKMTWKPKSSKKDMCLFVCCFFKNIFTVFAWETRSPWCARISDSLSATHFCISVYHLCIFVSRSLSQSLQYILH